MDGCPSLQRLRLQLSNTSFGLASPCQTDVPRQLGDVYAPIGWCIETVQLPRKTPSD